MLRFITKNLVSYFSYLYIYIAHNQLPKGPNDLFSNLSQIWAPLNLNLTTHFLNGGYYRQDIHSNKFSVLNLNSMYFYKKNKLLEDCNITDSAGALQLEWLERELKNARQEKRMVYISQHVPPMDDTSCFYSYVQLIGKYSDVICGHFTGICSFLLLPVIIFHLFIFFVHIIIKFHLPFI